MNDGVSTYTFENGEIERIQRVTLPGWENLSFLRTKPEKEAFLRLTNLYAGFLVPRKPEIFGRLALFCLPERLAAALPETWKGFEVKDPLVRMNLVFKDGLRFTKNGARFKTRTAACLYAELVKKGCLARTDGLLPFTKTLPVVPPGFLRNAAPGAEGKANTQFFTMDAFDLATPFDVIGTPVGLTVKDGTVLTPPLFHREALFACKNGRVSIGVPELKNLTVLIGGKEFRHGENAVFFERPDAKNARAKHTLLVITGNTVTAVKKGGSAPVPCSGFTLASEDAAGINPGDEVTFAGMEDVLFGIQAGTSAIVDGVPSEKMLSPFCNIKKPWRTNYPPSLYPCGYDTDRAPRMAIGANKDGNPALVWAEGMGKHPYKPGKESRGATLLEMGQYCRDAGLYNAVNLDGGGSAEILLRDTAALDVSDRDPVTDTSVERGVPAGIVW